MWGLDDITFIVINAWLKSLYNNAFVWRSLMGGGEEGEKEEEGVVEVNSMVPNLNLNLDLSSLF